MAGGYLTVREAAERLRVSPGTVKRYIYSGRLRATKMPGGQHRIAEADVDALLCGASVPVAPAVVPAPGIASLAPLEQRIIRLEEELDSLWWVLRAAAAYARQAQGGPGQPQVWPPAEETPNELLVLGPGCPRCDRLAELTGQIAAELAPERAHVVHVRDVDEIAAFGPILTPALVVNDRVVVSGAVPSRRAIREMLAMLLN